MLKKYLVMSLIALVFNLACGGFLFAQTREDDKNAELTAKIKTKVAKYGTGEKSKVKVELRNQTKIKGYVSAIADDSFTVTDKKTGTPTKIEYAQVKKVMNDNGLSTAGKIGIAVGIAVPVAILLTIFGIRYCNESAC
jgi:uncharacterized protein HemX